MSMANAMTDKLHKKITVPCINCKEEKGSGISCGDGYLCDDCLDDLYKANQETRRAIACIKHNPHECMCKRDKTKTVTTCVYCPFYNINAYGETICSAPGPKPRGTTPPQDCPLRKGDYIVTLGS